MSYTKLLLELKKIEDDEDDGFGPTDKFLKIYGNYCGPGNQGGDPIDGLDAACKKHDKCYHKDGRDNCNCDDSLIADIEEFLKGKKLTFKQRTFANMIKLYFKKKTARRCKQ